MSDYQKNIEQFKKDLLNLSNQTINDLNDILMNRSIVYQFNRSNSDIVIYLFEYDFELLGLTFYGLDKNFNQYTEHISIPTKFPEENWKNITCKSIYSFESDKIMKRYNEGLDEIEVKLYEEYFEEKYNIFESWFFDCWKKAIKDVELKKGVYFSIHDTDERIDLSSMEEISKEEIINKYK
nr:hypothetical protein [Flavobacterium sp. ASV13]